MKMKRRRGIAERTVYILMFMFLFQLSGAALNSLGLFTNPGSIGSGSSGYVSSVDQANSCQTYTESSNAATCMPSIGGTASILQNILVFGDWFGGLVTLVITFAWVLVNPFGFLAAFGVPAVIVAVMSGGLDVSWLFLGIWIRTGRPV